MKHWTSIRLMAAALLTAATICHPGLLLGQVETIDPNPTMPRDVGGRLNYYSRGSGGAWLGRATGSPETDPNPAETLLRSIEGTHYGRYTGHSIFADNAVRRAIEYDARLNSRLRDAAPLTRYSRRGASIDRVYQPTKGNHDRATSQRTDYQAQFEQRRSGASPKSAPNAGAGRRETSVRPVP
jgi:hypothetical protein